MIGNLITIMLPPSQIVAGVVTVNVVKGRKLGIRQHIRRRWMTDAYHARIQKKWDKRELPVRPFVYKWITASRIMGKDMFNKLDRITQPVAGAGRKRGSEWARKTKVLHKIGTKSNGQ